MNADALRLVIFDMDGTLIDSRAIILESMRRAFEGRGEAPPSDAATLSIVGLSLPEAVMRLHPEADAETAADLTARYKASFMEIRAERGPEGESPLFPGAREALERLAARGWLLSVATGKARRGLDHVLDAHGLREMFSFTQTADDARSKPHPEMLERCIDLHGVAPRDAVMIGDTTFDLDMGASAGAHVIGVDWGYHPVAELRARAPAAILSAFAELDGALDALWSAP